MERIGIAPAIIRRRQTIGWRREAIQTTSVCTLVAIGQHRVVGVEIGAIGNRYTLLGSLGLDACQVGLVLRLLSLVLRLSQLGLRLLAVGYRYFIVDSVKIVRI